MITSLHRAAGRWRRLGLGVLAWALLLLLAPGAQGQVGGRVDLNRAELEELQTLPITPELAASILDHREYVGFFESLYDLMSVPGMTPEILARLRPRVSTMPPDERDEAMERYDASFRQVQRFLSQEGASEEIADEYLDMLREPRDVNDLTLYELQSFQNISPIDAVAILKARERAGRIENQRQLRSSEGLRYFSYRNLRDYVVYQPPERDWKLRGDFQIVTFNSPYQADDEDALAEQTNSGIDAGGGQSPALQTKLRLRLGGQFKGGLTTFREVGEDELDETRKGFLSWRAPGEVDYGVKKVVLGNYRLAFGQGLVMDNTDFFLPRKTGYGWNKRPLSVIGDLSRSHEYALRGGAVELELGRFHATGFYSHGTKDGILNADGSLNRYISMAPRLSDEQLLALNEGFSGRIERDAFEEELVGGNVKMRLWPGTYVGLSGYEARYDRELHPDVESLFNRPDLLQSRDSELYADYDSFLGFDEGDSVVVDFRRIVGAEFQAVYENVALQGEYAKMDSSPKGGLSGLVSASPEAWVLNGMIQWDNFHVMGLYRDYDVGFDNPYSRAFSNDTRYEQTLLGDAFRLNNPALVWTALNNPQPKAEKGFFLTTRYRVSRKFTITGLDYDQWTRQADGQELRRYTARMEYAPIFPLRFRLRQRFSSRSEYVTEDVRKFRSWDTRFETRLRLSGMDELRFLYSATSTEFAPRPRLVEPADPADPANALPQAGSPGQALQAQLIHNVNPNLMVTFSSLVYDGFLWNFEDNEFVLLDGTGFRNWILVRSRISDDLLVRFKLTHDKRQTMTNVLFDQGNDVRSRVTSFRLQLDYTF